MEPHGFSRQWAINSPSSLPPPLRNGACLTSRCELVIQITLVPDWPETALKPKGLDSAIQPLKQTPAKLSLSWFHFPDPLVALHFTPLSSPPPESGGGAALPHSPGSPSCPPNGRPAAEPSRAVAKEQSRNTAAAAQPPQPPRGRESPKHTAGPRPRPRRRRTAHVPRRK